MPLPRHIPAEPNISAADVYALAEAMYFEANHQDESDPEWIAHVIINRAADENYPDTVEKVINQKSGPGLFRCQFTYKCDGKPETIYDRTLFERYTQIARSLLVDESAGTRRDPTGGAINYYNPHVVYLADGSATAGSNVPKWTVAGNCDLTVESASHRYFAPLKEGRLC